MVHDVTSIRFNGEELNFDMFQLFSKEVSKRYSLISDRDFANSLKEDYMNNIDVEMDIILSIGNWGLIEELKNNIETSVVGRITELIKEKSLDEYVKEIGIGDNEAENILYDYYEDIIQRHHELGRDVGYALLPQVTPIEVNLSGTYEDFVDLYIALVICLDGEEQLKKDFKLLLNTLNSLPLMDEMKKI